ncbi:hypothetical protein NB550_11925 [Vibrio parahaemolyticus]|jgi:hypothetical protein|uniref:hypothetical protein n=1 Tax=Vibrio parahaemolyticus TaxID=670 RepID=UPI00215BB571|nr:hypothetical protein [Vibrio parahaemolyticus]MCR9918201.1 hypothetical protein [Vibrio parahaemolyticus]
MSDNNHISTESRFILNSVDKLFHVFLVNMPEPITHSGKVDYHDMLEEFKNRLAFIARATNYIVETNHYRQSFEQRSRFEHEFRSNIKRLPDRRKLSQRQLLALSAWFSICQGLQDISKIDKTAPLALKAKERAFLFNSIPLLSFYIADL